MDYFSHYEVAHLIVAIDDTVITVNAVFDQHGISEAVVLDNGQQYNCILVKEFATEYLHTLYLQPKFPAKKRSQVATVKGLWIDGGEKAKLCWHIMPHLRIMATSQDSNTQ